MRYQFPGTLLNVVEPKINIQTFSMLLTVHLIFKLIWINLKNN